MRRLFYFGYCGQKRFLCAPNARAPIAAPAKQAGFPASPFLPAHKPQCAGGPGRFAKRANFAAKMCKPRPLLRNRRLMGYNYLVFLYSGIESCRKVVFSVSERAAMKRRVRGLLHRKWFGPLGALVLAGLPMAVTIALVAYLTSPPDLAAVLGLSLPSPLQDPQGFAMELMLHLSSPSVNTLPLLSALPGAAIVLGVYLFVGLPVSVSLSGYFLDFLRGKKPGVLQAFSCFSGRYPRALFGMLYRLLWVLLWALMAFAAPVPLCIGGLHVIGLFAEQLGMYQIPLSIGLVVLCVVWFVVFAVAFVNRLLAYSLTPVALAAQPRLPAHRAVRLSRKLMRGNKWRLIGLIASFLHYFLPALAARALLFALPHIAPLLSLSDILAKSIGTFLWVVVGANLVVLVFVAPYLAASVHALYIERKREALMDEEVTPDDFVGRQKGQEKASYES